MNITVSALEVPTPDSFQKWLRTPRLAKCGVLFTPSEPMWWPNRSARNAINWQAAIRCVPLDWQQWLHAALAYRMSEAAQGTTGLAASILSRAAQVGLNPLNEEHLVDLRERFNMGEFSTLIGFMAFWQACESLEKRPSKALIEGGRKN